LPLKVGPEDGLGDARLLPAEWAIAQEASVRREAQHVSARRGVAPRAWTRCYDAASHEGTRRLKRMRATLLIAGAALAVLAVVSLVVILVVEPSPPTPPSEPAAVAPEVAAAVAAAREAAVREEAAKQAAAEEAAKQATARQAAVEATAREAAAREAAAKEAATKERAAKQAAKEAVAKEGAGEPDSGAGSNDAAPSPAVARSTAAGEPDQEPAREARPPSRQHEARSTASIAARMDELKPRLAQCYEVARGGSAEPREKPEPPVFVVELEGAGEQYRVVGAGVDSRGGAEDAVLECMQSVLLGATITTPGVEIVDRVALRFSP
jgi:hypothetical protein